MGVSFLTLRDFLDACRPFEAGLAGKLLRNPGRNLGRSRILLVIVLIGWVVV
jgi:hypothetical protein